MQTYIESGTNYKGILLKLIQYNKCHHCPTNLVCSRSSSQQIEFVLTCLRSNKIDPDQLSFIRHLSTAITTTAIQLSTLFTFLFFTNL